MAAQRPDTVASAIRIVEPVHATWVHEAIERLGGSLITVTDEEILVAWSRPAHTRRRLSRARLGSRHRRAPARVGSERRACRLHRHGARVEGSGRRGLMTQLPRRPRRRPRPWLRRRRRRPRALERAGAGRGRRGRSRRTSVCAFSVYAITGSGRSSGRAASRASAVSARVRSLRLAWSRARGRGRPTEPSRSCSRRASRSRVTRTPAPALAGGVCLRDGHAARVADDLPALPIAVIPETQVSTSESRDRCPARCRGKTRCSPSRAALLGASIASAMALFAASHDDRLHEPYPRRDSPSPSCAPTSPPVHSGRRSRARARR